MGISDLLDTPPNGTPGPRFTPRSPVSIKELTAILALGALAWGAYDRLNKFAEKTAVEHLSDTMWQQRLENQHNFDRIESKVDQLIKVQAAESEKHTAEARRK